MLRYGELHPNKYIYLVGVHPELGTQLLDKNKKRNIRYSGI